MRSFWLVVGLTIVLVWGPVPAKAQGPGEGLDADPPISTLQKTRIGRDGLLLGLDMFAGNGLESDARVGAGLGIRVGWMLSPSLALLLDTHGVAVGSSQIDATEVSSTILVRSIAAASVQWWPTRRFWLRGGMGPGRVEGMTSAVGLGPSIQVEETKMGFGATLGTGYEFYQGPLFALDLHAHYDAIRADGDAYSNLVVGLGFGWYPQTVELKDTAAATPEKVGEATPKKKKSKRWLLGLGALGGLPFNNDCDDCYWDMAAGMAFQVGYMLTPRLRLSMDTQAAAVGRSEIPGYDAEANPMVQGVVGLTVQYWTGRRIWVKGGIGRGEVRQSVTVVSPAGASFDIIETETGFGTLVAVGYELHRGRSIGFDVNAQYAGIHGDTLNRASLFVGVGMGWYVF